MKNKILIVVLLMLLSCQKKQQQKSNTVVFGNKDKIAKLYTDCIQKDEITSDTIINYTLKLEQVAAKEPREYRAMIAIVMGLQSSNNTSYQLGFKYYENALFLLHFSTADSLKAKAYSGMGNNYKSIGDYPKAFKNLYKSLALYEKINNAVGVCSVNTMLGEVYFQMDQTEKAKPHFLAGMKALENQKSTIAYLTAAHSLANYYGISGDFQSALKIDEMGIRITDSIAAPKVKVSFLDNKANCYLFSNRMDSAYYYFKECLKLDMAIGNKKQIADTYSNLGQFFMMKKNFSEAEKQIQQSITLLKSIDCKPNLEKSYTILMEIYTTQQQFKKAFAVQNEQIANSKNMIEEKEAAKSSEYKIIYETQKKESKIRLLEQENKIRNLTIHEQQLKIERKNYLMLVFGLLLTVLVVMAYFWKSRQKLQNLLEQEKIIQQTEEHERIRIAKDIHDDLGSGLSKINFLSEVIFQKTANMPEVQTSTEAVKETAKKMIENMRDLIWALNPDNTTIANLIARMREYTTDYLEDYSINIEYDIPVELPQTAITKESHRELFMVVKETLNNISKHAAASQITFNVQFVTEYLLLSIKDNGVGFDETKTNGNGIRNMKSRIAAIDGQFEMISKKPGGTTVIVRIPLQKIAKK